MGEKLEVLEDLASFGKGVGFHEFGTKVFGTGEVIDVDFVEVFKRFVGEGLFGVELLLFFGVGRVEVEMVKE